MRSMQESAVAAYQKGRFLESELESSAHGSREMSDFKGRKVDVYLRAEADGGPPDIPEAPQLGPGVGRTI